MNSMATRNDSVSDKCEKPRMGKGLFYHRILKSLLISSLIFALISIAIFTVVLKQITLVERESNSSAYVNQLNSLNIAEMSISQMLSTLDTYVLDSFLDSEASDNFRYYYALKLYSWLSANNGSFGDTAYRTVIISRSDDGMVITPTGSCTLDYYIERMSDLSSENASLLRKRIEEGYPASFAFAEYGADGIASDAYFAKPYSTDGDGYAIILSRFYLSRFFTLLDNEEAAIIGPAGQMVLGSIPSDMLMAHLSSSDGPEEQSNQFYSESLAGLQWRFAAYFRPANRASFYLIIWLLVLLSFAVLLYFLVFRQASLLYSPFSEALSGGEPGLVIEKNTDEMELLITKNQECRTLVKQLSKANEEMELYEEVRENRNLLEGLSSADDCSDVAYHVAVVMFSDENDRDVDSLAFQIGLRHYRDKGIRYIPYGNERIALIIEGINDAKAMLLELLHLCPDEADVKAVLSGALKGMSMLHSGYEECLKLLRYSSSLDSYRIITQDDIRSLKMSDDFTYSADDEQFFIKLIMSGNPQAYEELNEICSRNAEGLSYEAKYSFSLCLLSTLSRLFSELKKSPEEIVGHSIDFEGLVDDKSPDSIIANVRAVFEEVISSVCNSRSQSDGQMISMMKNYIHENYMHNIGLQNMADKFNITPKYCGMIFSRLSSDNFKNYLNQYRIEEAKKIIESDPSIKVQDLASVVGFNSPNTFIRVFSRYTGMTPKSYADIIAFSKN